MKKLLLILLAATLLVGCRSKKKITERTKKLEVLEAQQEIEAVEFEVLEEETFSNTSSTEINSNETSTVEIEADSTGTVTREVVKTDTGFIETFTGVKNVKVVTEKSEEKKVDTSAVIMEKSKQTEKATSDVSVIKINREEEGRKTNVEIQSGSTWFWILLFIIVVIGLYVWLKKKRIL